MNGTPRKKGGALLVLALALALAGCATTTKIAQYQAEFGSDLMALHEKTMTMLLAVEAAYKNEKPEDAAFDKHRTFYEATAPLYLSKLELRAKAGDKLLSLKRLADLKENLEGLEAQHRAGTLNKGAATLHRRNLQISFKDMLELEIIEKDYSSR